MLGLVFSIPSCEIGLERCLPNDLFCVEWHVKPQLSQLTHAEPTVMAEFDDDHDHRVM